MNPERPRPALAAADAAARRLLVRAIDLRFNLEDAAETIRADHGLTPEDLWRLRADADALRDAIDALADALWPPADGEKEGDEAESEEATEALSPSA